MNQKLVGLDIGFGTKPESFLLQKGSEATLEACNVNLHFPELK